MATAEARSKKTLKTLAEFKAQMDRIEAKLDAHLARGGEAGAAPASTASPPAQPIHQGISPAEASALNRSVGSDPAPPPRQPKGR